MAHQSGRTKKPAVLDRFNDQPIFIRLDEDKEPVDKKIIPLPRYTLHDISDFPGIGLDVPMPYVVVDIDEANQAEKLTRLVLEEGIRCQIMQTTRGRHFWFAVGEPVKNSVKATTGIGLVADYRSWGKDLSYVAIKHLGEWREWLTDFDWDELDELPWWLRPLRQSRWRFWEMGDGDGRNQALFEYQILLAKRGINHEDATEALRLINKYVFREPLPEDELRTVTREEAYPEMDDAMPGVDLDAPWFTEKGKFLHNAMGDVLIDEMHIISRHDHLYVYKDGYYQPGEYEILRSMIEKYPTSKRSEQNEVLNYITIQRHIDNPPMEEYVINVKNGRLDLRTGELHPHTPEAYDFQQLNAVYNPSVYYEPIDRMLVRVFCGDYQLYKLFEEMLGYCLIKNCRMQKIFIMFGDGNNGKSTLLRMICEFIGDGNYSTLSLQDLETTFRPAELENKLVNLGDDIPATTIKDSSRLKSISSGERITVERKNKDPFILKNYATMIFTTNKMPLVNDKSFGFYRRLILIPLDAKFSNTDPDFDPDITQKVVSEEARSYLLNMAIRGLRRLLKKGFTRSEKVEKAIQTYKVQSSHTLTWLTENDITEEYLRSKHTGELFYEFKIWCEMEGIENVPRQQTFTMDIQREFDFQLSKQQRDPKTGRKCRYFVPSSRQENEKFLKK
jgi:putative DNA primase/helicase